MTLAAVRAAAIDRALVGGDADSALALAGTVDAALRSSRHPRPEDDAPVDPFAAAMLTVGCLAADRDRTLDDGAWRPGRDADSFVVAGAAVAVCERNVTVDRAADLAGCSPATVAAAVDRRRGEKRNVS